MHALFLLSKLCFSSKRVLAFYSYVLRFPPRPCRCRAILHVVSGASPDPVGDFRAINQELALFSEALALKPQVI